MKVIKVTQIDGNYHTESFGKSPANWHDIYILADDIFKFKEMNNGHIKCTLIIFKFRRPSSHGGTQYESMYVRETPRKLKGLIEK